ncbi:ESX-1 type VII secretion system transcriptional regulator EspM [Mycobacterium shinjukuense]|uniref:ESX-1 type VII secretion system transcriptional regulator EspM n=1 Tax=Mycobacterium shinjukuense TaxID=398694 RepID=UPI001F45607C|nr:FHA domain-containing protein [Mycobacterium shinjukuense]
MGSGRTLLPALPSASEESTQMPDAESTGGPAPLVAHHGASSRAIASGRGPVTGRAAVVRTAAGGRREDPRVRRAQPPTVSDDGRWRIVDDGHTGKFVDGRRRSSVTINDTTIVRFGDPTGGKALTFEVVRPSNSAEEQHQPADKSNGQTNEPDPGVVRAGAAAAARRRELDISQRSLAADGIINAGALIAFEKGRSWPRERTRAKLEEVLRWPAGTIARIRRGEQPVTQPNPPASSPPPPATRETSPSDAPASLIAQAVAAAVDTCSLAIAALPSPQDPEFTERAAPILADLRQLEAIAVQATRISRITPELIKALGAVRRHHDELMTLGATAPGATLAQRLYAARRRANLSTSETAQAAGVTEEMIVRAEAEEVLPASAADKIEALISQIN